MEVEEEAAVDEVLTIPCSLTGWVDPQDVSTAGRVVTSAITTAAHAAAIKKSDTRTNQRLQTNGRIHTYVRSSASSMIRLW